MAAEPLFRLSVVFDLVYAIAIVVLLTALYTVLSPVNRYLALLSFMPNGTVLPRTKLLASVQGITRCGPVV